MISKLQETFKLLMMFQLIYKWISKTWISRRWSILWVNYSTVTVIKKKLMLNSMKMSKLSWNIFTFYTIWILLILKESYCLSFMVITWRLNSSLAQNKSISKENLKNPSTSVPYIFVVNKKVKEQTCSFYLMVLILDLNSIALF